MIPSQTLIDALRAVVKEIEKPDSEWNWGDPSSCNCGLLARKLGLSKEDIRTEVKSNWTLYVDKVCLKTGLPLPKVFATLRKYGITNQDIEDLEDIDMEIGIPHSEAVVDYCLNKANELEQQLLSINSSKKKVEQKVSISL